MKTRRCSTRCGDSATDAVALLKLALRGISAKKARFALTTASILFGVAFMVGVFVTTDGFWELKRTRTERPEFGDRP